MADIYYPQCWVRLVVRFENFIQVDEKPQLIPSSPGDPVDIGVKIIDQKILPTNCSVTLNSYRNADECRITMPFGKLPIDPRWLRSASVQVFMGTLSPEEFAGGIGPIYGESEITLIDETPDLILDGVTTVTNEVFRGIVDDWDISQDGNDSVSISCRDMSSVLIDLEMPLGGISGIPKEMRIDEVIREILIGEETAKDSIPSDLSKRPRYVDARRDSRRLRARIAATQRALDRLEAEYAKNPSEKLQKEGVKLAEKLSKLQSAQVKATAVAAEADSTPILNQRYGCRAMRGLVVRNATGEPLPKLSEVKGTTYFDSKGNASKSRSGGSNDQISYWDFITDLCVGSGLICYFATSVVANGPVAGLPSSELVIDRPKTYYKPVGLGRDASTPTFAYGRNVDTLKIKRSFTGKNVPTGIVVSAIDAKTGDSISTRYPVTPIVNRPMPDSTGVGDFSEYKSILLKDRIPTLGGLTSLNILENMAASIYEQMSRGEFIVNIETTSLTAWIQSPGDIENLGNGVGLEVVTNEVDMLQVRAGDPIRVLIIPSVPTTEDGQVTQAGNFTALGPAEKRKQLEEVYQFSEEAAALAAVASESPQIQELFYVRQMGIDFDAGSGFKFAIEAINYLDVRNAVEAQVAGIEASLDLLAQQGPQIV